MFSDYRQLVTFILFIRSYSPNVSILAIYHDRLSNVHQNYFNYVVQYFQSVCPSVSLMLVACCCCFKWLQLKVDITTSTVFIKQKLLDNNETCYFCLKLILFVAVVFIQRKFYHVHLRYCHHQWDCSLLNLLLFFLDFVVAGKWSKTFFLCYFFWDYICT